MTTEHVIDLTEGSQSESQFPYRDGLGAREVTKEEVDNMLEFGIIEIETTPCK